MAAPDGGTYCRTVEEAFLAGVADAAGDPPPTEAQVIEVARLLGRLDPELAETA